VTNHRNFSTGRFDNFFKVVKSNREIIGFRWIVPIYNVNSPYAQPPLLAKAGNIPCDAGGAYSPPYQGGVGGG